MSGHEVMVQRITAIIAELYQYSFVSRKKMMDEFNISERTLYRDLNRLGDRIVPDGDGIYRLAPVARRFFLHKNAINFALSEGAKKTHSAQCKNERKECLLMLLLSRITFVESRQADSIFESYITM